MFSSFYRIIKFAMQGFWRNIWLSFITISVIVLALVSVNFLIVSQLLTKTIIESVEEKIDLSIYFKPEIAESQINEVKINLLKLPEIANVKYVSKEKVMEEFKRKHQDNSKILESLEEIGENPFGATLIVKAKTAEGYPTILRAVEGSEYKDLTQDLNFDDHKLIIQKISEIAKIGRAHV